jgi:hypothetical protein
MYGPLVNFLTPLSHRTGAQHFVKKRNPFLSIALISSSINPGLEPSLPNQVSVPRLIADRFRRERRSPCQRPFFAVLRRAGLLPRVVERPRPENVLGAERQRVDPVAVALQLPDQLALRRLPHVYRAVSGAAKSATCLRTPGTKHREARST